ncbi:MAG: tRNA (adenosine(37)-N6)-threonylcarbamoyltransferase complex dimerization subunit type 1 TsaB [Pseudomonadales bacterium]|nr:tRNA (adenosine(37)-N6)-threonylcarbamoyltransferase complex dimerization subunit type 1 TsaB [Pseudomonadales bacterium]
MVKEISDIPNRILAIDTSTKTCVLGLQDKCSGEMTSATEFVGRSHSEVILPKIIKLLEGNELGLEDLDLIVYGKGPGSFTGLRIGVGVVQGLAFGLDIPVVGVSSMACLAQEALRLQGCKNSIVALTARLEEVYYGVYSEVDGFMTLVGKEGVSEAIKMPPQDTRRHWVGLGSGWKLKPQIEKGTGVEVKKIYSSSHPNHIDILALGLEGFKNGNAVDAIFAQPEYLRETVADIPRTNLT